MNEITKYEIWTEEYEMKYIDPESLKPGEAHEIVCDRQGYSWPTLVASFENEQEARAEFETMTASREQVWRGEWKCHGDCGVTECSACGWNIEEYVGNYNFCPVCGAPMTDEAVQMVKERLEALHETVE